MVYNVWRALWISDLFILIPGKDVILEPNNNYTHILYMSKSENGKKMQLHIDNTVIIGSIPISISTLTEL